MNKMTLGHFTDKVLPLLAIGCKSSDELRTKATEYVADVELVDDAGAKIELDTSSIEVKAQTGDEPSPSGDGDENADELSPALLKSIEETVTKAVAKAQPVVVKGKRPGQIEVKSPIRVDGRAMNFKGTVEGKSADERAYRFGRFIAASVHGHSPSIKWCSDYGMQLTKGFGGMETKVHQEGVNSTGGYLVPEEFGRDMIDLRLQYGVFRRNARTEPMASDSKTRPRRVSGLTAYFTAESSAGTESTMGWDQVQLVAKKLMVLTKTSNEVNDDAFVNLGDTIAGEIAYAFANKEDECGFNGTGTSTYGGIHGVISRLSVLNGVDDGGGMILAAGNAYSEITLQNFHSMIGRLPTYARSGAKWFASPAFHDSVMQARMTAAGGATVMSIGEGAPQSMFLGYPVELVEVMPTTEANSQICCLFGNMAQAADFGDRKGITIATSDSALNAFEKDEIAIRGIERFDINVHDVGTASAAGPIVCLITAGT